MRYVHPPGAKPEREPVWREVAVNRPGDCQGPGSVWVPSAGTGELGQRAFVFEIPVGPGVDQRGGRQEIAFVVVASAIGKDEVFDSINTAANTRYEVVGVRCPAERPATVKTAPGLQVGQTLAQRLGRGQPVSPEKMAVKVLLFGSDFVDRRDHPGPVQLDQRPDQWG